MKKTKFSCIRWNRNVFLSAMRRIGFNIFLIVFLDALFYFSSAFLVSFWYAGIIKKIAGFKVPADILSLSVSQIDELAREAAYLRYFIIGSFIILILAIIFFSSILKGVIWARTAKTKITFALISKFLLLNLIWMGFWIAVMLLAFIFMDPAAMTGLMMVLSALAAYFTGTLYSIFMKTQKLSSMKECLKLNALRVKLLALPYAVAFAAFIALIWALIRVSAFAGFSHSSFALGIVLLLFYIAAFRYYAFQLAEEAGKF